ncbi:TRAP transporter small permease [Nitratireductor sp. GCM10026969]|uniref:TRAP transporter small permease n=1 Tax=Nitratireductor sp. GCM10026969 TaxID=3252645 RepID=UPI00361BC2FB
MRQLAARLGDYLNRGVEIVLILLMAALVVDVWIGVADRYYFHWQFNWPEPLARYLMIWTVLLAISSGIVRREHIGLTVLIDHLPEGLRRAALILSDLLAFALFAYLFWFGIGFAASGQTRQAMIFGLSLGPAYAAVPVAAGLAAVQLLLVLLRDLGGQHLEEQAEI